MINNLDLKHMLEVNQLMVDFDNLIESLTDMIHDFWENLLNNRESKEIYEKGMSISDKLKDMQNILANIEKK